MGKQISLSQFMFNKIRSSNEEEVPIFRFKHRPYQLQVEKEFDALVDEMIIYICWARRLT